MFGFKRKPEPTVEVTTLKSADSFLIVANRPLCDEERARLAGMLEGFRSGRIKTLVLEAGMRVIIVERP